MAMAILLAILVLPKRKNVVSLEGTSSTKYIEIINLVGKN
jgi:hypothetical protein